MMSIFWSRPAKGCVMLAPESRYARGSRVRGAVFPSKIWNSIALGRGLVCRFLPEKWLAELEAAQPRAIRSAPESVEAIT
jgi:hypothetical protein